MAEHFHGPGRDALEQRRPPSKHVGGGTGNAFEAAPVLAPGTAFRRAWRFTACHAWTRLPRSVQKPPRGAGCHCGCRVHLREID
jgi:hypothetical protein